MGSNPATPTILQANDDFQETVLDSRGSGTRVITALSEFALLERRISGINRVPGVNNLGKFGRWAFAEFKAVYEIERELGLLIEGVIGSHSRAQSSQRVMAP